MIEIKKFDVGESPGPMVVGDSCSRVPEFKSRHWQKEGQFLLQEAGDGPLKTVAKPNPHIDGTRTHNLFSFGLHIHHHAK